MSKKLKKSPVDSRNIQQLFSNPNDDKKTGQPFIMDNYPVENKSNDAFDITEYPMGSVASRSKNKLRNLMEKKRARSKSLFNENKPQ